MNYTAHVRDSVEGICPLRLQHFFLFFCLMGSHCDSFAGESPQFILSKQCPIYFQKVDGRCFLNTPYQRGTNEDQVHGLRMRLSPKLDGLDPQQIDLGRLLFFDPILSQGRDVSCAHCHDPALHWSDGQDRSRGVGGFGVGRQRDGGKLLPRSTPTLWNLGFRDTFFWDGRARTLESQALGPLNHPDEMGGSAEMRRSRLNRNPTYRRLFKAAFGLVQEQEISDELIVRAIASFERSLISLNSRYDRFVFGQTNALDDDEVAGFNVFRSFVSRCSECHVPPLFTNQQFARIGVPNVPGLNDLGLGETQSAANAKGAFLVPSLRNIAATAPYMHAGQFLDLRQVIQFYNLGGRLPQTQRAADTHWHVREAGLSQEDVDVLIKFLGTLTDETGKPEIPRLVPSGLKVLR
jgi:cytochrome c peroxidase